MEFFESPKVDVIQKVFQASAIYVPVLPHTQPAFLEGRDQGIFIPKVFCVVRDEQSELLAVVFIKPLL